MERKKPWVLWLLATLFGLAAWLCVWGQLTIPIPATQMIMDPREVFVTLGSALTGPGGAVIIGILAGIYDPAPGFWPVTVGMHVAGALFVGTAYRFAFRRFTGWMLFPVWVLLILLYYGLILVPVMILGTSTSPVWFQQNFPDSTLAQAFANIYGASVPEMLLTTAVTTLILVLLPPRLRRPLW